MKKLLVSLLALLMVVQLALPAFAAGDPPPPEAGEETPLEENLVPQAIEVDTLEPSGELYTGLAGSITYTGDYTGMPEAAFTALWWDEDTEAVVPAPAGLSLGTVSLNTEAKTLSVTVTADGAAALGDFHFVVYEDEVAVSGPTLVTVQQSRLTTPEITLATGDAYGGLAYSITEKDNAAYATAYAVRVYNAADSRTPIILITSTDTSGTIPLSDRVTAGNTYWATVVAVGDGTIWKDSGESDKSDPAVAATATSGYTLSLATLPGAVYGVYPSGVTFYKNYVSNTNRGTQITAGTTVTAGTRVTAVVDVLGTAGRAGNYTFSLSGGNVQYSLLRAFPLTEGQKLAAGTCGPISFTMPGADLTVTLSSRYDATAAVALKELNTLMTGTITLPAHLAGASGDTVGAELARQATALLEAHAEPGFSGFTVSATAASFTPVAAGDSGTWKGKFTVTDGAEEPDTATDASNRSIAVTVAAAYAPVTDAQALRQAAADAMIPGETENPFRLIQPGDATNPNDCGYIVAPVAADATTVDLTVQLKEDEENGVIRYYAAADDILPENALSEAEYTAFSVSTTQRMTKAHVVVTNGDLNTTYDIYIIRRLDGPPDAVKLSPAAWEGLKAGTAAQLYIELSGLAAADLAIGSISAQPVFMDADPPTASIPPVEGITIDATGYAPGSQDTVKLDIAASAPPGDYFIRVGYVEQVKDGELTLYTAGYSTGLLAFSLENVPMEGVTITDAAGNSIQTVTMVEDGEDGLADVTVKYAFTPAVPSNTRVKLWELGPGVVETEHDPDTQTITLKRGNSWIYGTTRIIVQTEDGHHEDTLWVTVTKPVAGNITLRSRSFDLKVGDTAKLSPQVPREVIFSGPYTYTVHVPNGDEPGAIDTRNILSVDENGTVTAKNLGTAFVVVHATDFDGTEVTVAAKVTVKVADPKGVQILDAGNAGRPLPSALYLAGGGRDITAEAAWLPNETAINLGITDEKYEWSATGPVAELTPDTSTAHHERVTFKVTGTGTVTLTAKLKVRGKTVTATHKMAVYNAPVGYTIGMGSIKEVTEVTVDTGKTIQLKAVPPSTGAPAGVGFQWMSRDSAIATVDAKGKVTGVKAGSTEVFLAAGGTEYASVTVVVRHQLKSLTFAQNAATVESDPANPEDLPLWNTFVQPGETADPLFTLTANYVSPALAVNLDNRVASVTFTSDKQGKGVDVVSENNDRALRIAADYAGRAKVTATYKDAAGAEKSASFTLTVVKKNSRGYISTFKAAAADTGADVALPLVVGKSATLKLTVAGVKNADGTGAKSSAINKNAVWQSSHPDIISVDAKGKITALRLSSEPVTITARPIGKTASTLGANPEVTFHYRVAAPATKVAITDSLTGKALGKLTISNLDEAYEDATGEDLRVTVTGGEGQYVRWASSNPAAVEVAGIPVPTRRLDGTWTSSATLVWKGAGTAKITATAGGKTATLTVTSKHYVAWANDIRPPSGNHLLVAGDAARGKLVLKDHVQVYDAGGQPVAPENWPTHSKITWTIEEQSAKNVVTLKNGVLTAKNPGDFLVSGAFEGDSAWVWIGGTVLAKNTQKLSETDGASISLVGAGGKNALGLQPGVWYSFLPVVYSAWPAYPAADALAVDITSDDPDFAADVEIMSAYAEDPSSGQAVLLWVRYKGSADAGTTAVLTVRDTISNLSATCTLTVLGAGGADVTSATATDTSIDKLRVNTYYQLEYELKDGSGTAADQRVDFEVYADADGTEPLDPAPVLVTENGLVTVYEPTDETFYIIGTPQAASSANLAELQAVLTWTVGGTVMGTEDYHLLQGTDPTGAAAQGFDTETDTLYVAANAASDRGTVYLHIANAAKGGMIIDPQLGYSEDAGADLSSDKRIATAVVEEMDGIPNRIKVTGVKKGTVKITFRYPVETYEQTAKTWVPGTETATVAVKVCDLPAAATDGSNAGLRIQMGKKDTMAATAHDGSPAFAVPLGKTVSFNAAYRPTGVGSKTVMWDIHSHVDYQGGLADDNVASVDHLTGKLTAENLGEATLEVWDTATGRTAECTVVVYDPVTKLTPLAKTLTLPAWVGEATAGVTVASWDAVRCELAALAGTDEADIGRHAAIRYTVDKPGVAVFEDALTGQYTTQTYGNYIGINAWTEPLNQVEIIARGAGTATVTAENLLTKKKTTFKVKVVNSMLAMDDFAIAENPSAEFAYEVAPGKSVTPKLAIQPAKAANKVAVWTATLKTSGGVPVLITDNVDIETGKIAPFTINPATGMLTAHKDVAYAEIRMIAAPLDGSLGAYEVLVCIRTAPKKITLSGKATQPRKTAGETYELPTALADTALADVALTQAPLHWTSSDPDIARLEKTYDTVTNAFLGYRLVSGGNMGRVTLTAETFNGKKATFAIDFVYPPE